MPRIYLQRAVAAAVTLLALLMLVEMVFQLGFRVTYISPGPGWDCWPTWTFDYKCSRPDGTFFGGRS